MILTLVILTSLKILAIWVCLQPGMIFGWLRVWLESCLPKLLHKPLFDCLTCMGGFWTVMIYLVDWPACGLFELMVPVIGLNYLIALWKDQFFVRYGEDHQR